MSTKAYGSNVILELSKELQIEERPRSVGSLDLDSLRGEIDEYYVAMRGFRENDPADNLVFISGFTARASQIRSNIVRVTEDRYIQNFRTKELDPFLTECDRQFKVWSRLISAFQLEWETSRGQK